MSTVISCYTYVFDVYAHDRPERLGHSNPSTSQFPFITCFKNGTLHSLLGRWSFGLVPSKFVPMNMEILKQVYPCMK